MIAGGTLIFDPHDQAREIERFSVARQPADEHLSIADYVAPVDSGRRGDARCFSVIMRPAPEAATVESTQG